MFHQGPGIVCCPFQIVAHNTEGHIQKHLLSLVTHASVLLVLPPSKSYKSTLQSLGLHDHSLVSPVEAVQACMHRDQVSAFPFCARSSLLLSEAALGAASAEPSPVCDPQACTQFTASSYR